MKKIFKKNQVIITTLALMIAVAGYLNYSGKIFGEKKDTQTASSELAKKELLDISEEDAQTSGDIKSPDLEVADGEIEGTPGEAVLTSAEAGSIVAEAKVAREQVRAKNKATLQEMIDNANITNEQKEVAVAQMISMIELSEKEVSVETLFKTKGLNDAVISLTKDTADVVVSSSDLTDAIRAQIEDIVSRKAGIAPENIVITPIHTGK